MKLKKGSGKQVFALAMVCLMFLSAANVSAAALQGGPYVKDLTTYGYEEFKTDFDAAAYTAFEDFEQLPDGLNAVKEQNNLTGNSSAVYPFEMAVSGVDNGSFSLKLNDTSGKNLIFAFDVQNGGAGDPASGNYAIIGGKDNSTNNAVVEFAAGDSDGAYNVMKADGAAQTGYKISAIGFALTYGTARKAMNLTLTYDDGSTENVIAASPDGSTRTKYSFCAVKAPEGKYITGLKIAPAENASFIIDNFGIIFYKVESGEPEPEAPVPTEIKIEGDNKIYTPSEGATEGSIYTYRAYLIDAEGNEVTGDIPVSLTLTNGNAYVEFNEETGELTVLDAAAAGSTLIFEATAEGFPSVQMEVAVSEVKFPQNAYQGIHSSLTSQYTFEAFKADFEESSYTAYEDFEDVPDGYTAVNAYSGNKDGAQTIFPYEMAVSGVENGSFPLKLNNTNAQATNLLFSFTEGDPNVGELSSGSYAVLAGYNNSDKSGTISIVGGDGDKYNVMKVNGTVQKDYKISAMGFTIKYGSMRKEMNLIVTYTDGTEEKIETPTPASSTRIKSHFCGVKAPEGKYITGLTIKTPDNNASFIVDDLGIIFDKVIPVPDRVRITGPDKVQTPLYGVSANSTYTYKAFLADQSGDEMESDEEISMSLSGGNSSITFNEKTGVLSVSGIEGPAPQLTLTAKCGEMTDTLNITVQNASYYNEDNISSTKFAMMVGETSDTREENDTTGDALLSREEFVALLDSAIVTDGMDMTVINFMGDALNITSAGVAQMPLHKSGKVFSLATAARHIEIRNIQDDYDAGRTPTVLPTSGTKYYYLQSQEQGGNEFIMNSDALGDLRVTAMGLVVLAHNSLSVVNGFRVKATYSNGKIGYFSANIADSPEVENNVFFGIKAPVGHYITNVEIINAGQYKPTLFSKADEFGFIFEVPDIIPLDRDSAALKFSDISDERMENITKDLKLDSLQTIGSSKVEWSTKPAGIIAQDGKLTPPDAPDDKGNTPQVNLIATFHGKQLTKERVFELFVPSKLEMDRNAIVVPTETSDDITLPVSGQLYGSTITWSAGENSLIDTSAENLGKVTRPQNKDKYVLLTATISNSAGSVKKDFGVMVKASGGGGSSGGSSPGGSGSSGGIASPTVIPAQKTPVEIKPAANTDVRDSVFGDLSTKHWAYKNIKELYEKGIVNGTGESTFDPEGKVTREQYLAMLVRAFGFENAETEVSFTDVSKDAWYYNAVLTAQRLGISNGYADGSFGIGKNITREEMAVMAYRAAQAAGIALKEEGVDAVWNDSGAISEFAAGAVSVLNKNGIIKGMSENEFSPKATSTRAQATVIISRLLGVMTVE